LRFAVRLCRERIYLKIEAVAVARPRGKATEADLIQNFFGVSPIQNSKFKISQASTHTIKEVEFFDNDDEFYAKFYLLDAQGRPVFTGSASALRAGLTMPETPGIYHLVLEGKAGRKVVKVAVGQKKF
jgi:hypothetical protein